jgi:hypothetical protein
MEDSLFKVNDVVIYKGKEALVIHVSYETIYNVIYESMCAHCPFESICHEKCETCDAFDEALEEAETNGEEGSYEYAIMIDSELFFVLEKDLQRKEVI